ncbi:unnamed protein product, partial [Rotaria sp. Silwood1]
FILELNDYEFVETCKSFIDIGK